MKLYFSFALSLSVGQHSFLASARMMEESTRSEKWCMDESFYDKDDETDGDHSLRISLEDDGTSLGMVDMPMHPDGATEAWSLNDGHDNQDGPIMLLDDGETYHFESYSSFDDNDLGFDFDKASKLPKLNYLLNRYRTTDVCGNTTITYKEVQQAIWSILDEEAAEANPVAGHDVECATALTIDALEFGYDFSPCDVEDGIMALLLVVDLDFIEDSLVTKIVLVEVPAVCYKCEPSVGIVVGDPHIYTFDGLTTDCQGDGEFILTKSQYSYRQVQARFTHFTTTGFWSVVKSVVVQDATSYSPIVQVNVPVFPGTHAPDSINGCPVQFFVDGEQLEISEGSGTPDVLVTNSGTEVKIMYPDTGFLVTITAAHGAGICFLNLVVSAPADDHSLIGLLGTNNDNPMDDWTDFYGFPLETPTTYGARHAQEAYEYCTTHWCIRDSHQSLYTHSEEGGVNFDNFMHCDLPYGQGHEVLDLMPLATPEVTELCRGDEMCLLDGIAGGLEAARSYLETRQAAAATCNTVGGECTVSSCCGDLVCVDRTESTSGERVCVEPVQCSACAGDSTGVCQNKWNQVCFMDVGGLCPPGTDRCTQQSDVMPLPIAECAECWPSTSGPCQLNGVCYPLQGGTCPLGTSPCHSD